MDADGGFQESVSPSCSENRNCGMGVFECNICFDLAQDPIVTLCGHLFCWPCLYNWLQFHSFSGECPVCKSLVREDDLVPIYGRGTSRSDLKIHPLSREIPSRPASRRPQTAPVPELTYFRQDGFGAISSRLNFQVGRFHDTIAYEPTSGVSYGFSSYAHGGYVHGFNSFPVNVQGAKSFFLKICFMVLGLLVVLLLISTSLF